MRSGSNRARQEARSASEESDPSGIQVLRDVDHHRPRTRDHVCRGPERVGEVQRRRRHRLGHGRAGRQESSRRQDGGCHLRGHQWQGPARPRRGRTHHRQRRRSTSDRVLRGLHPPHVVPQRRLRIRHQWPNLPTARRPGVARRLRYRPRDARDRWPGAPRRDPARQPRGPARLHRRGRRCAQASPTQGEGASQT